MKRLFLIALLAAIPSVALAQTATVTQVTPTLYPSPGTCCLQAFWEALDGTDQSRAAVFPANADATVEIIGTFDSVTVTLQGSISAFDETSVSCSTSTGTWHTLEDGEGENIALTAAGLKNVLQNPPCIRVVTSGGGGTTDIDVYLWSRGNW